MVTLRGIGRGFLVVIFVFFLLLTIVGLTVNIYGGLFFGIITFLILFAIARTTKSSQKFEKQNVEGIFNFLEDMKKELNNTEKDITKLGLKNEKFLKLKQKLDQMFRDAEVIKEVQEELNTIASEELTKLEDRLEGKSRKKFKQKANLIEKLALQGNIKEIVKKLGEIEVEFDVDLKKSNEKFETFIILTEKMNEKYDVFADETDTVREDFDKQVEDLKNFAIVSESDLQDGFSRFSWREMEELTGKLFEKKGYSVEVTQGSGDFGIDVWAKKDGLIIGIQVKKWINDVGFDDVTKTLGSNLGRGNKFILISTTSFFTPQAWEHQGQHSHLIELWDTNRFITELRDNFMISTDSSNQPTTIVPDDKIDSFDFDKGFNLNEVYDEPENPEQLARKCPKCGSPTFSNTCGSCGKEL